MVFPLGAQEESGDKEKEKKYYSSTSFSLVLTRGNNRALSFSFDTEQNLRLALEVADYIYILSKGVVVYRSTPEELRKDEEAQMKHLGVAV